MSNDDAKIKDFIRFLSSNHYNENYIQNSDFFNNVVSLYKSEYRHSYSDMLNVLTEIGNEPDGQSSIGLISGNIEIIKAELIIRQDDPEVKKKLNKFYDHIVLEITRLELFNKAHEEQKRLLVENDKIRQELQQARGALKDLNIQLSNSKTEFVTILSVFAAIILAFSGGLGLNNSILGNMDKASIYKLATMAIIVGFVLFNTIVGLMHIVSKLVGKDISHRCNQCNSTSCNDRNADESCNPFIRVRARYPYVYYVNLFFVVALGVIFFAWFVEIKYIADYVRKGVLWNIENCMERVFGYCFAIVCVAVGLYKWVKRYL